MVARAMRQVFDTLRGERDRAIGQLLSFDAKVSFFQITNEKVYDLLGDMGGSSNGNNNGNSSSNGVSSNGGGGSNGNSSSSHGSTTMVTSSGASEPLQLYEDPTIAAAVSAGSYAVAAAAITALLATNNNNTIGNTTTSNSSSSSASSSNNVTSSGALTSNTNTSSSSSGGVSASHLVSIGGGVFVKGLNEVSVVDDGEVAALVERGLRARASDKHTNGSDSHVFLRLSLTVAGQYLFRLTPTLIYILLTPTGRTHMRSYDCPSRSQVSIYLD